MINGIPSEECYEQPASGDTAGVRALCSVHRRPPGIQRPGVATRAQRFRCCPVTPNANSRQRWQVNFPLAPEMNREPTAAAPRQASPRPSWPRATDHCRACT